MRERERERERESKIYARQEPSTAARPDMQQKYLGEYSGETTQVMRSPPFSFTGQFDRLPLTFFLHEDFPTQPSAMPSTVILYLEGI
jgi:hypothetical protein